MKFTKEIIKNVLWDKYFDELEISQDFNSEEKGIIIATAKFEFEEIFLDKIQIAEKILISNFGINLKDIIEISIIPKKNVCTVSIYHQIYTLATNEYIIKVCKEILLNELEYKEEDKIEISLLENTKEIFILIKKKCNIKELYLIEAEKNNIKNKIFEKTKLKATVSF